jgi:hypothetical protein
MKTKERKPYSCPYPDCHHGPYFSYNGLKKHLITANTNPDEAHRRPPPPLNPTSACRPPPPTSPPENLVPNYPRKYKRKHSARIRAAKHEYNPRRLDVILNLARRLPESNPARKRILTIIETLNKRRVPRRRDYQTIKIPTDAPARIFVDVQNLCPSNEQPLQSHDITTGQLSQQPLYKSIAAFFGLERHPNADTTTTAAHPTSIWSIPSTSEDGLKPWSERARKELTTSNPSLAIDTFYSTTVSPAGTISTWHVDQFYSGTLLVGLDLPKLFVMCPPTEKNMEIFSKIDHFHYTDESWEAISKFEDLSYIVLTKGDVYLLPPGYIHMVISMRNSAVGGWKCYKPEWEDVARRLTNREMAILIDEAKTLLEKGRTLGDEPERDASAEVPHELQTDLEEVQKDLSELQAYWAEARNVYAKLKRKCARMEM